MAATNRNKIISLTDYTTGAAFMLSSCQIINFIAVGGANDTLITYINQRGKLYKRRVTQSVSTINTACISNAINIMIPITLSTGVVMYLNIDRVIYVDNLTNSSPLVTEVTYDAFINPRAVYQCSLPTAADFAAATDNIFAITTQPKGAVPSKTRYINNYKIARLATELPKVAPVITFTTNVKSATGVVTVAGTGYTNPTVAITGGGGSGATGTLDTKVITATVVAGGTGGTPGAVTITGTTGTGTKFQATGTINGSGILTGALVVTVAGDYSVPVTSIAAEPVTGGSLTGCTVSLSLGLLSFAITGNGTGYTSYPTFGVVDATGINGAITANMLVESPLVIVNGGEDINTAVTLTFSSGTTTAIATATVSASTQSVTATSLTNAGAYKKGTDTYPTLAITGGSGGIIVYDAHNTSFVKLEVEEVISTVQTAVNAL